MQTQKKVLVGIAIVAVLGLGAWLSITQRRDQGIQVSTEVIGRHDLVEIVTASGNIRARRTVDISSDVSARVAELLIDEGDDVRRGQTLLRLDPTQYQASAARSRASLAQAQAQRAQQEANLIRAQRDLDRLLSLRARDSLLVSRQQIDDTRTTLDVTASTLESAEHGVAQAQAAVAESDDQLSKTIFSSPIDGKVTRLNVEEGETVIIGTMNNPGSLVLTISDLSVIEVVVQVDETDVSLISLGDSASIRIDAFPNRTFVGVVTEIGNSAINPPSQQSGGQQAAIDFEVVLTLQQGDALLRPDLSATADIVVETRKRALGVPIIAMTVREDSTAARTEGDSRDEIAEVEGVFLVHGDRVEFTAVEIGIAGQEYFEVLAGLSEGDTVVAGPYQRIRQLINGDQIVATDESPTAN
ncbi:MAG: efflux RND transporter periplasmic adaptor subunit [Gemmatimonadota bacterium]|nr:efflux RND transporter periplasmic adaptor subunit [Gemmatimonadota bacterium]MDH3422689.1 efflux RND transporter periplasmic adaptor subunit [Gemmatimonadota bacterium]